MVFRLGLAKLGEYRANGQRNGLLVVVDPLDGGGQGEADKALNGDVIRGSLEAFLVRGIDRGDPQGLDIALLSKRTHHQSVVDFEDLALLCAEREEQNAVLVSDTDNRRTVLEAVLDIFITLAERVIPIVKVV